MTILKSTRLFKISKENDEATLNNAADNIQVKKNVIETKKEKPPVFATNTIVICCYHCCGSTTFASNHDNCKDLEASMYSKNVDGTPNKDFPNNYLSAIKWQLVNNNWKYLFVSCHKEVIDFLKREHIPFVIIYPEASRKEEIINIAKERGNKEDFLETLANNYEQSIERLAHEPKSYPLAENEFISDDLFENKLKFLKQ